MDGKAQSAQRGGAAQALLLLLAIQVPILPIAILGPNLPQLIRHFAGTPNLQLLVTLVMALPSLGIVAVSPAAGWLADRRGRRIVLLTGLGLCALFGLLPMALEGLPALLASQFLLGVGEGLVMTSANTLLGDYFAQAERERWLGRQSILGPFFNAAITLAAGWLGDRHWNWPFAANIVTLGAFVWALVVIFEPARADAQQAPGGPRTQAAPAAPFPWRRMAPIYAVTLLSSLVFYIPTLNFGLLFDALGAGSTARIATLMTIATASSTLGGWYFSRQRASTGFNLGLTYAAFGAGLLGMGLAAGPLGGLGFALVINFGIGLILPLHIAWALRNLPGPARGRGMGLWMSCFFIMQVGCPFVFAPFESAMGGLVPAARAVGAAVLALGLLLIVYAIARRRSSATALPT